jgi:hypothetical protein
MKTQMTISEIKILWVVGALERLATLGMLSSDIPLKLTPDAVDDYIEIDNHRNLLFSDDFEIAQIFLAIAKAENKCEVSDDDMNDIIKLILEYKNNRTELVKYALSHQTV